MFNQQFLGKKYIIISKLNINTILALKEAQLDKLKSVKSIKELELLFIIQNNWKS